MSHIPDISSLDYKQAQSMVRPVLGCLRLNKMIMRGMIEGQNGCSAQEVGVHTKKVDYRLSKN